MKMFSTGTLVTGQESRASDPHYFNADPDPAVHLNADQDLDLTFHFNADPDRGPVPASHQSDANLATTGLQALLGSILSLHASTVSVPVYGSIVNIESS
jgi:hypothetical protein